MIFRDRSDAGLRLAAELAAGDLAHPILLALPRGGVPVAAEVAQVTGWPLEIVVSRKLAVPGQPELGFGAVSEGGVRWLDPGIVRAAGLSREAIDEITVAQRAEVSDRVQRWRRGRPIPSLRGRTAILVDDGMATGGTMRAALAAVRGKHPERIVVAVPISARDVAEGLSEEADDVVCVQISEELGAIGAWYHDFRQVSDEEVDVILNVRHAPLPPGMQRVLVPAGGVRLEGELAVPPAAVGVVVFAHGSGSGRFSPRNKFVAERLRESGLGTLLFDLLTDAEEQVDRRSGVLRFDVEMLGRRVRSAVEWLAKRPEGQIPIGCFGASTGAAAALIAAADRPDLIRALVSRGGRPDLAGAALDRVTAPTLLLVGDLDRAVVELNREAMKHLKHGELQLVPGANHLFEEPGALEQVAESAATFMRRHLGAAPSEVSEHEPDREPAGDPGTQPRCEA